MIFFLLACIFSYNISRYDPYIRSDYKNVSGYLKSHSMTVDVKSQGDFGIITYNMEKRDSLSSDDQINEVIRLIDNTHVPIMVLQEVSRQQLNQLENRILPHYGIAEGLESLIIDPTNGSETFNPIIYDTEELNFEKSGVFKTNDFIVKNVYASWALFTHKTKNFRLTMINMNLYSTKSLVDSLELASILYDIEATPEIKENIVFLAGTINGVSSKNSILMKKKMTKLSDYGNEGSEQKNTLNTYLDVLTNTERDFIFCINTVNVKAQPVYSSVLRLFRHGARFPVHSIVNLSIN
ncbi:hypothetical protein P3W45_000855 [Vairimorpha bombi]|jgi:hypothetical protein